jgi:hypothetical protein
MDAGVAFSPAHGYGPCPARNGVLLCPVHGYGLTSRKMGNGLRL